ncbi:metal ABC transporter solute-binding protein, Zn/Mn family [Lacticaseibacillus zhaodongensis]|uniref:metal ABC transporter solute-binding protein, Zn/Mn family n=1 Tax=Lacticaseibacillus zhaodongensis TaxID=2668065 RepID=UPI001E30A991|nr:zinc ABC transporter substrate-binding protein [Lacticaseibacillus zhaodongensis]
MLKRIMRLMAALLLTLTLAACRQQSSNSSADKGSTKITVVTSLKVYQEVAAAVLGRYGHASAIIANPNVDPHDFAVTTDTAKRVADAQVVVTNGLGYDDWLDKLIDSANPKVQHVDVARNVLHRADGANEHVFYDPGMMPKLARKLAQQYGKLQPQHRAYFDAQAAAYIKSLRPLQQAIKHHQNSQQRLVATSEPVFDYALAACGYKITAEHFAKAIEDGTDPSPQDVAQLRALIREHKLAFFVDNVQSDSPVVSQIVQLAEREHVKVVRVRETQPRGKDYLQWMLGNYAQLPTN